MFDLKVIQGMKTQDNELKGILNALKKLENTQVLVGIPEESGARKDGDGVTNAELLYIHTHGSPINNIPPRPVIEPAIEDDREIIGTLLGDAAKAAADGDDVRMMNALEKAGLRGQNTARLWFKNPKNNWSPNQQATIDKKGSDRPLVNTGEMRDSIIYVIREKK
jgi:hypothetical protein